MSEPTKTRSPDFRLIYANALGMRASDNDFQITLSIEIGAETQSFQEEATVMISPRTAKLLWHMLGGALEEIEKTTGPITIDEKKLAGLKVTAIPRG